MYISEEGGSSIIDYCICLCGGTPPLPPRPPPKQQTKEQLGYIVFGGLHLLWNKSMVGGLHFRVLSKTHGPEVGVGVMDA